MTLCEPLPEHRIGEAIQLAKDLKQVSCQNLGALISVGCEDRRANPGRLSEQTSPLDTEDCSRTRKPDQGPVSLASFILRHTLIISGGDAIPGESNRFNFFRRRDDIRACVHDLPEQRGRPGLGRAGDRNAFASAQTSRRTKPETL
jgi:hypothetical protein